jgi:hypothetical protein
MKPFGPDGPTGSTRVLEFPVPAATPQLEYRGRVFGSKTGVFGPTGSTRGRGRGSRAVGWLQHAGGAQCAGRVNFRASRVELESASILTKYRGFGGKSRKARVSRGELLQGAVRSVVRCRGGEHARCSHCRGGRSGRHPDRVKLLMMPILLGWASSR